MGDKTVYTTCTCCPKNNRKGFALNDSEQRLNIYWGERFMYATWTHCCVATLQYIMFHYLVLNRKVFTLLPFDQCVRCFPFSNITGAEELSCCSKKQNTHMPMLHYVCTTAGFKYAARSIHNFFDETFKVLQSSQEDLIFFFKWYWRQVNLKSTRVNLWCQH